ncbi:hypothetical protein [Lysobacter gummosus]|uniref:hypothetical protein n=1 Tax=Lysobacter gummosus TaxID=262324 RepID=UPI00363A1506
MASAARHRLPYRSREARDPSTTYLPRQRSAPGDPHREGHCVWRRAWQPPHAHPTGSAGTLSRILAIIAWSSREN